MDHDRIHSELIKAAKDRPSPIGAHTFLKRGESFSRPLWLECEDGQIYVVKGQHAGRSIFNDQVIARLGTQISAPVGNPALVMIPRELQEAEEKLVDITPGVAHGTLLIPDTSDRQWLTHTEKPYNRQRFSQLAILYGWLFANDQQLVYSNHEPYLVYSVDHGHFFPGGPDWTLASIAGGAPVQPYPEICNACNLSENEIKSAVDLLSQISDEAIIQAVAIPPDDWKVSIDERTALVEFIISRRDAMLAQFAG